MKINTIFKLIFCLFVTSTGIANYFVIPVIFYIIGLMYPIRTRFAKDIVTELLPPVLKKNSRSGDRIVIFSTGMPSVPSKPLVLEFFSKKGYWVFFPRYRGTWESDGKFLRTSPERDIKDVIDGIHKPFQDTFTGKQYKLKPKQIILVGSSFGGPAALLNSKDKRVSKVLALSTVVDWTVSSKVEPLETFWKVVQNAFGEGYRFSKSDWDKLKNGNFYNPVGNLEKIEGKKVFIAHAKDDDIVSFKAASKFASQIGAHSIFISKGGHLASKMIFQKDVWRKAVLFLKK